MRERVGGSPRRPLHYVARVGLLPELSRQTYDSLDKALREAILNSFDAGADHVKIDVSKAGAEGQLVVRDNGCGMSAAELEGAFLSLGGSSRFRDAHRFGRIGIGSLAILHYGQTALIRTKQRGSGKVTHAVLDHPWELGRESRLSELADFVAGEAWEEAYAGPVEDQFTEIALRGLDEAAAAQVGEIGACYALLERLRRVLPLPFPEGELAGQLKREAPRVFDVVSRHTQDFGCRVEVVAPWERVDLVRRTFGEQNDERERWVGAPRGFLRSVHWGDPGAERTFEVAGYLLSQERANPSWSGLTVRIQNVAVEERCFFDLEADPGFRRYICGEVFLVGDVPREDLIALDRSALVREASAFPDLARVVRGEIQQFKTERVQRPRRRKVDVRRIVDEHVGGQEAVARVAEAAQRWLGERGLKRVPSSLETRRLIGRERTLRDDLAAVGAECREGGRQGRVDVHFGVDGQSLVVVAPISRIEPTVSLGTGMYRVMFADAPDDERTVVVRNRPRQIMVNVAHRAIRSLLRVSAVEVAVALEIARVVGEVEFGSSLDERLLAFLSG